MALLEIEVKARVRDAETLAEKLVALGCALSEPQTQDDIVFVSGPSDTLEVFLQNDVFARIRIEGERAILTVKKPIRKSADVLVKQEHEVVVSDAAEARRVLELLGHHEAVRVVKTRRTGHAGQYEVCLDVVEGLGTFIELEQMGTAEDAERIQSEMMTFLASLDIAPEERVTRGYDILALEQQTRA